jgi:predicted ABC-class ATPase
MTPEQEIRLIGAISARFGSRNFDLASIICAANGTPELAEAIDTAIPNARYRSGSGKFRRAPLETALKPLAARHFDTDRLGWWYVREPGRSVEKATR